MLKIIAIVYAVVALAVAMITTFMQVQPALFFIELLTDNDNMFPIKATMLFTMLALLLPLIPILLIAKYMTRGNRDQMPDLYGKTGVVVKRDRSLYDALYTNDVLVNGEKKSGVSNGKSTFIELPPGVYKVFIKGATSKSAVVEVNASRGQIITLKTGYITSGLKNTIFLVDESPQNL